MHYQSEWPFGQLRPDRASPVARQIAQADFSPYTAAVDVARELKRYFLIRRVLNRPVTLESKLIDDAWHKFILDTRNYCEFCQRVFGEYLHHVSDHFSPDPQFPDIYRELFGESPPEIWRPDFHWQPPGPGACYGGGWFDDGNCA